MEARRFRASKPNPNIPKSSKARQSRSKKIKEKRLGFPWILFAELSLFNRLY